MGLDFLRVLCASVVKLFDLATKQLDSTGELHNTAVMFRNITTMFRDIAATSSDSATTSLVFAATSSDLRPEHLIPSLYQVTQPQFQVIFRRVRAATA